HAVAELTAMEPRPGEESELAEARRLLMNREKLLDAARAAHGDLAGERGADSLLASAQRRLDRISDKAGDLTPPIIQALDRAAAATTAARDGAPAETADAGDRLHRLITDPELAPHRLAQIEERLFALRDLARKHGVPVDALADHAARLAAQVAALDDQTGRLA